MVTVLAAAAAVASVAVLLAGAIAPRGAGETVSGDAPAAAATASPGAPAGGSAAQPADPPAGSPAGPAGPATGPTGAGPTGAAGAGPTGAAGAGPTDAAQTATPEQAAAIDTAALDVKAHPKDIAKHITLAHAYADGGEGQLAAVEYLAILRLDPGNAEANTALALLAFEVGQPQQAKDMLDAVLAADPAYPEALYVRGLVLLSGLHQPAAATRDLHAYLSAAPYGSHRTAAETLLALAGSTP
ncbi:MAG TPA: tetratricopeptide repeat protein [Mycobacteriales bacterium]|nr:tetratricopeptide repeat protein [Mycobacteriales bacterium]